MPDPWTTTARMHLHMAAVLRGRATGRPGDVASLLTEAERLEACAERQHELAAMHGGGVARWSSSRPEPRI